MSEFGNEFQQAGDAAEHQERDQLFELFEPYSIDELEQITTDPDSSEDAIRVAFELIEQKRDVLPS